MQQPIVIDFDFNNQGVWIVVQNISASTITSLIAAFSANIWGIPIKPGIDPNASSTQIINNVPTLIYSNRELVSGYPVFKECKYIPPGKQFLLYVENEPVFNKINPASVNITVACTDSDGKAYNYTINHNFDMYKQMTHIINS